MKKTTSVLIIAMVLVVTAAVLFGAAANGIPEGKTIAERAEKAVSENIPFGESLSGIMTDILYMTGVRFFDGTYIGNDGSLLRDVSEPDSRTVSVTKSCVSAFGDIFGGECYFMLIPTASVIRQQELDSYAADGLFNQRRLINDTYSELGSTVRLADVYQVLFSRRSEYIYYYTESLPTSLGGFYIYSELAGRMNLNLRSMQEYSAYYAAHDYYGSLASGHLKKYSAPDFITLYESAGDKRKFTVTQSFSDGSEEKLSGIYQQEENYKDKTDMIFGGINAVTEISSGENGEKLLVFGDDTVKSWLPFMLRDFGTVTVVNLSEASDFQLEQINISEYSKAIFAYGIESYTDGIDFARLDIFKQ